MRLDYSTDPKDLTSQQVVRLHEMLHAARFPDPKVGGGTAVLRALQPVQAATNCLGHCLRWAAQGSGCGKTAKEARPARMPTVRSNAV